MKLDIRGLALLGVSAAALCAGAPAVAVAADEAEAASLEEVVVTARRREERLQDVPQAATSLSASKLEAAGVTDSNAIMQLTPSLNMPHSGTNLQPNIRGIGTTNSSLGDEPNVALYLDGVYQATPAANTFALTSIQRIEVLKGPQGTLFGRNSQGGAILITTKSPSRDFGGDIAISFGTHERATLSTYVTGPLGDKVAADLAIGFDAGGPVYYNIISKSKMGAYRNLIVRPKVVVEFTDATQLTLGGLFSYNSDPRGNIYGVFNGNTRYKTLPLGRSLPVPSKPRETAIGFEARNIVWTYQGFARLEHDFENFAFSSQSAITMDLNQNRLDTDQGPLELGISNPTSELNSLQQEFLFTSTGESKLEWVGGLFLYKSSAEFRPRRTGSSSTGATPLVIADTFTKMRTRSYAPFGELVYNVTDRLSLTGGARYTYERKAVLGYTNTNPTPRGPASSPKHWTSFTPRGVVQYKIPEVVNLYGSISKGFKSGVFVQTSVPAADPVDPETLLTYELGLKTLMPGRWRASGAVFFNDYKNIQVLAFQFPTGILRNASTGESYGFETEVNGQLTDELNVNAFVSYSHTEYTNFTTAVTNTPDPVSGGGNVTNINVVASGKRFQRAPTWLGGASFTYVKDMGAGDVSLNGSYYYNSGFSWEITGRVHQKAYSLVNASLSWEPTDTTLKLSLWANNLTNEDYSTTGNASTLGDNIIYGAPRTVGFKVAASFP